MPRRCSFKLELDFPQPLAGVDEAGCAPLAGPVVAGACILNRDKFPRGIDDSKNLPIDKREAIYAKLVKCSAWGVGIVSVDEIDQINIYWARMLAMTRAVEALGLEPAWVLVDGNACPKWQRPSKAIVDGDAKCRSQRRSSPRSLATASWRTMPVTIQVMAGRRTGATGPPSTGARFTRSAPRRSTAAASRRCAQPLRRSNSRTSSLKSSAASLSSHTHHQLSLPHLS